MTALTFDTLKYANALKKAGIKPEQAEAQASALSEVLEVNLKELVTRKDLQIELQKELAPVKAELAAVKADVLLLKWMVGVIVAGVLALVIKAFLHV